MTQSFFQDARQMCVVKKCTLHSTDEGYQRALYEEYEDFEGYDSRDDYEDLDDDDDEEEELKTEVEGGKEDKELVEKYFEDDSNK